MEKPLLNILLFFLLGTNFASAQFNKDLELIDSLIEVAEYQKASLLTDKILEENPRNFMKSQLHFRLSTMYLAMRLFDKAKEQNQQSLDLKNRIAYEYVADNYWRFGQIDFLQGDLESAFLNFNEAKDLPHEDIRFSGILDGSIGLVYQEMGEKEEAEKFLLNALEILSWELDSDAPEVLEANKNLGKFNAVHGSQSTAVNYFKAALPVAAIQQKLKSEECLIQLFYANQKTYAFKIDDEGVESRITEGLFRIKGAGNFLSCEKECFLLGSYHAYQQFVLPFKTSMSQTQKIYFIGEGIFQTFPFEALIQSEPIGNPKYKKLNYLIKDYAIGNPKSIQAFLQTDSVKENLTPRFSTKTKKGKKLQKLFLKNIGKGLTTDEALRAAQLKMINRSCTAKPRFWASYY